MCDRRRAKLLFPDLFAAHPGSSSQGYFKGRLVVFSL